MKEIPKERSNRYIDRLRRVEHGEGSLGDIIITITKKTANTIRNVFGKPEPPEPYRKRNRGGAHVGRGAEALRREWEATHQGFFD